MYYMRKGNKQDCIFDNTRISDRAKAYSKTQAIECYAYCGYERGATDQRTIDIENCVKWCENFNKEAEKTGCEQRIDVESFRQWITNMIMSDGKI